MSAQKVWLVECDICSTTKSFDPDLSVEELGEAARELDWELPIYGGMFCPRCSKAVKSLSKFGLPGSP